ncbi:putative holin-like toxin [Vagococcus fluvialis]|nr:putative holin-like toxin [Vagococcus fluvialis]
MRINTKSKKGEPFLSELQTIDLLLKFGMFVIALIGLVVTIVKNDKKK